MNNEFLKKGKNLAAILLVISATAAFNAQSPIPPAHLHNGSEKPHPEALREIITVSGAVSSMVENDDFIYDGFYVKTNGESVLAKFAPHMGKQILTIAKEGSQVSIKGMNDVGPDGERSILIKSITVNGKTVEDTAPVISVEAQKEVSVNDSGIVTDLQKTKRGDVGGIFIGQTILKIPPHIYQQLEQSLVKGAKISFTGFRKTDQPGEVSEKKYTIIHLKTISVNGKEFSL